MVVSILAELTRFDDRQFYKDWWNAQKFDEYWRLVESAGAQLARAARLLPLLEFGAEQDGGYFSGVLRFGGSPTVLVSGPCHVARLYAFAGMMGQVPLIALTNALHGRLPSNRLGNVLFWVVFCVVGQPMALMPTSTTRCSRLRLRRRVLRGSSML